MFALVRGQHRLERSAAARKVVEFAERNRRGRNKLMQAAVVTDRTQRATFLCLCKDGRKYVVIMQLSRWPRLLASDWQGIRRAFHACLGDLKAPAREDEARADAERKRRYRLGLHERSRWRRAAQAAKYTQSGGHPFYDVPDID